MEGDCGTATAVLFGAEGEGTKNDRFWSCCYAENGLADADDEVLEGQLLANTKRSE